MTNEVNSDSTTVNPSPVVQSPSPIVQDAPITPDMTQAPVQKENFIKKIGIVPIVVATVLVILLVGGIVFKTVTSSPKAVFKNTINNLYKGLNNGIDELEEFSEKFDLENKALILNGDIKLDLSDGLIEDMDININDYSFGGELGIDINNEILQASAFIKGQKEKIDVKTYFEDGVL
ncbi:MAG: hypothetical protein K2H20_04250, partial [Bacilli bacterium]|nr:hypothetical protein [Bacilli bacterium]